MKLSIKNKVAFVSGASRGIGMAITIELLENGAKKVYAGARNIDDLKALKVKYKGRLVPLKLDITKDETIKEVAQIANDVEILVNNSGMLSVGNFLGGNLLESLKANLEVNLWGMVKLTDALMETIRKNDEGAIVSVSSVGGLANMPMELTYSVSKAAVHSVIQGLRGELKHTNILVSGVYPGPVDTDFWLGHENEMPKSTPKIVAENIVKAIQNGVEDIYPDDTSKQVSAGYNQSPKAIEEMFSKFK